MRWSGVLLLALVSVAVASDTANVLNDVEKSLEALTARLTEKGSGAGSMSGMMGSASNMMGSLTQAGSDAMGSVTQTRSGAMGSMTGILNSGQSATGSDCTASAPDCSTGCFRVCEAAAQPAPADTAIIATKDKFKCTDNLAYACLKSVVIDPLVAGHDQGPIISKYFKSEVEEVVPVQSAAEAECGSGGSSFKAIKYTAPPADSAENQFAKTLTPTIESTPGSISCVAAWLTKQTAMLELDEGASTNELANIQKKNIARDLAMDVLSLENQARNGGVGSLRGSGARGDFSAIAKDIKSVEMSEFIDGLMGGGGSGGGGGITSMLGGMTGGGSGAGVGSMLSGVTDKLDIGKVTKMASGVTDQLSGVTGQLGSLTSGLTGGSGSGITSQLSGITGQLGSLTSGLTGGSGSGITGQLTGITGSLGSLTGGGKDKNKKSSGTVEVEVSD